MHFFLSPHAENALLAVMVKMDKTGFQAATVEMEPKVRWAWLDLLGQVVLKARTA